MTKEQFLDIMEQKLLRLPKADRDDILSDYEAHFDLGRENGQTEEEVSAHLGDPAELAQTYLENLPENAKGEQYIPVVEAEHPEEPAAAELAPETAPPAAATPNYGYEQTPDKAAQAYAPAASQDKGGMIALVVVLSLFVALPVVSTVISFWFGLLGITIGCIAGGIAAMVGGFAAALANVLLCIGLCLLGLALMTLSGLMIVGLSAGVKGIVMLIKWYVGLCKKLINGGTI